MRLLFRAKTVGVIGGEIGSRRKRRIRRIAIDHRIRIGHFHAFLIGDAVEFRFLCFFRKVLQLGQREVWAFVAAKRHVEFTLQIVPAKTVVAMTVQIQEQLCTTERIRALVKLSAVLVVSVRVVVLRRKKFTRLIDILVCLSLNDFVEGNEIVIDIREDIARKVGVQEHRPSAHKGLDKTLTFRQVFINIV
ncbi:hypothetical protein D3C72_1643340 [compost metagenome]